MRPELPHEEVSCCGRCHPIGMDTGTAPEGEGIRYLGSGTRPEPAELLEQLADGRKGSKRPKV